MSRTGSDAPRNPQPRFLTRRRAAQLLVAMVVGVFFLLVVPLVGGSMLDMDYTTFWSFFLVDIAFEAVRETWQGKVAAGFLLIFVGVVLYRHTGRSTRIND